VFIWLCLGCFWFGLVGFGVFVCFWFLVCCLFLVCFGFVWFLSIWLGLLFLVGGLFWGVVVVLFWGVLFIRAGSLGRGPIGVWTLGGIFLFLFGFSSFIRCWENGHL